MARIQGLTMQRGNRGLLLIALLAGLVAAVLVFVALASGDSDGGSRSPTGPVTVKAVVAAQSITAGTEITAEMLKTVDVPETLALGGVYDDSSLVVGQTTGVAVAAGEQITRAKLGSPLLGSKVGISPVVQPPNRAVSFQIQELTSAGGLTVAGDHVDIVATTKIKAPEFGENAYIYHTEVILQNIEVLSIAQQAQDPRPLPESAQDGQSTSDESASVYSGQLPEDLDEQPGARTATVSLDVQQTLKLISYQDVPSTVRIWAILRGFGDSTIVDIGPQDVVVIE